MIKLPFRVIIYILKFHALEINIKHKEEEIDYYKLNDRKFKISELFGYFKLDKWRKIFKLYEYLSFTKLYDYLIKSLNFVSIKTKPIIVGCILCKNDIKHILIGCNAQVLFYYVTSIKSLKWFHILFIINQRIPDITRRRRILGEEHYYVEGFINKGEDLGPSNITDLKLMCYSGNINIIDYPKLKNIYINTPPNYIINADLYAPYVNLIGFKKWKGTIKTDTSDKVYIK